jgi:hypothetical protein
VVEADVLAVAVAERLTELDADAADSDGLDVDGAPHPASRAAHAARIGAATRTGTSGELGSNARSLAQRRAAVTRCRSAPETLTMTSRADRPGTVGCRPTPAT